jgi:hypothetical protein
VAELVRPATAGLVAPEVTDDGSLRQHESPLVGWLLAGMATAAVLAVLAAMVTLVDRFLRASRDHVPLLRLGVARGRLRTLEAAQFGLSYMLAMGAAIVFGIGSGTAMTTLSVVDYPVGAVAAVIVAIAVVGLLTTSVVLWSSALGETTPASPSGDR